MKGARRTSLAGVLAVVFLLVAPSVLWAENGLQRMFKKWGLFEDLQLSGYNTLTLQKHDVEGSADSFQGQRWDTDSFMHQSSLHAEGSIWKEFGFQADISASGYGPRYSRWLLGYVGHDTAVYYGDLNVDLGGNEFVSFRKTLKGWQVDQVLPHNGILRYFESEEKGLVRRQTLSGNNTPGPYFLTYTPIIEGSEIIKINEQRMTFGRDYRLDYDTGELWFEPVDGPPRIVAETDTISASYQSYGYGASPSTLTGVRLEIPLLNDRMLMGYTRLEEKSPSRHGDTVGYHEDLYQGSGTTGPFDTSFRPIVANGTRAVVNGEAKVIEQALVVLVDNVEQKETVDYEVNRHLGRILFRRSVPPTSLVVVKYYYDLGTSSNVGSGSTLWGLDLGWTPMRNLTLKYDYGQSTSEDSGKSGEAHKLLANYNTGGLRLSGEWRSIDPTFSFLNSVGFYRHEKGYQWRADWEVASATTLYYESSNLVSSQGYSFGYSGYTGGEGFGSYNSYGSPTTDYGYNYGYSASVSPLQTSDSAVSLDVTAKRTNYGFRFAKPRWPGVMLSIQRMENLRAAGSSSYEDRQLQVQYVPSNAPYSISLTWSDNTQDSSLLQSSELSATHSGTKRFQASATYTPSQRLSLSANLGTVDTGGTETSSSSSKSTQMSVRWSPSDQLTLSFDHSSSTSSGQGLSYSSYSGSYGGWSNYGGFSPGGYGGYGTYSSAVYPYATLHPRVFPYTALPWQTDEDKPPPAPGDDSDDKDDGETTVQTTHYEDSSSNLSLTYQPSSRLAFDLSLGTRKYVSGGTGYLSDSNQTYRNASMMWQLSDALTLQAAYGNDTMRYLEEGQGAVSNRTMSLGLNFRPSQSKWGGSIMLNKQTGSSPTYLGFGRGQRQLIVGTNLTDLSGRIYYTIGQDMDLYLQLGTADYSGGYAAFEKQTAELGVEKRLSDRARATFGYRYIRNITDESSLLPAYSSVATQSQDYIASTWLLTFNMNFQSGLGGTSFRAPTTGTGYYSGSGGYSDMGGLGSLGGYGGNLTTFGGYRSDAFGTNRGWRGGPSGSVFGGVYGGGFETTSGYGSMDGLPGVPGMGQGPGGQWRERGPSAPSDNLNESPAVAPDPWESVGDGLSLW